MDIKLLNTHVTESLKSIPVIKMKADGSNAKLFFCADVVGNKTFAQNFGGYPRSEIAQINEATNLQVARSLFQSIEDYSPKTNPTAGMTDAQIALAHKSRYAQAPSEIQSYLNDQLALRDAARAQIQARLRAAKKPAAAPPKTPSVNVEPE